MGRDSHNNWTLLRHILAPNDMDFREERDNGPTGDAADNPVSKVRIRHGQQVRRDSRRRWRKGRGGQAEADVECPGSAPRSIAVHVSRYGKCSRYGHVPSCTCRALAPDTIDTHIPLSRTTCTTSV